MTPAPAEKPPDAEALYLRLRDGVAARLAPETVLVGIRTGGAWLAERLGADLSLAGRIGLISSTLHRDDFGERGMAAGADATQLPFSIEGARILLIDDVLHTGRTIRAVINELYDFGRPASVALAVMIDRAGRELPIEAAFAAARLEMSAAERLSLARSTEGRLSFAVEGAGRC